VNAARGSTITRVVSHTAQPHRLLPALEADRAPRSDGSGCGFSTSTRGDAHAQRSGRHLQLSIALPCADVVAGGATILGVRALLETPRLPMAAVALVLIVVPCAGMLGLYGTDALYVCPSSQGEASAVFQLAAALALATWSMTAITGTAVTGAQLASLLLGFFALALGLRATVRAIVRSTAAPERYLIVGDCNAAAALARALATVAGNAVKVEACVAVGPKNERALFEELADPLNLASLANSQPFERIIVAPSGTSFLAVPAVIHAAQSLGVQVGVVPVPGAVLGVRAGLETVAGVTVLGLPRMEPTRAGLLVKRMFDVVGAIAGLILTSPLLGLVALLVKLDSPGPVLFRQTRAGQGGKPFEILKFRSMEADADARKKDLWALNEADGVFKIADDPRQTRVGHAIRKLSLDELPQLWNVLRGEMSLVGPRPLVYDEDRQIEGWLRHRLRVRPGMTGHWQVLGSSRIPLHDMTRIDCSYVANWTLLGDLKLILRTIPYVLLRRGM